MKCIQKTLQPDLARTEIVYKNQSWNELPARKLYTKIYGSGADRAQLLQRSVYRMVDIKKEFLKYLYSDLRDNLERLKDAAYADSPDIETVDYHYDKANALIDRIENVEFPPISKTNETLNVG